MTLTLDKKTFLTAVVLVTLLFGALAFSAQAQATHCTVRAEIDGDTAGDLTGGQRTTTVLRNASLPIDEGANSILCTYGLVLWVTNILFTALLALAILFIVLAAFFFVTAGGNTEKLGKAKTWLLYAVIGLVVAVIARIIPAIVQGLIGLS